MEGIIFRYSGKLLISTPDFSDEKMTKKNIYKKLYPGKKYSEQTMKNMLSALLKLGEQYLVQTSTYKEEYEFFNILAYELIRRRAFSLSEKALIRTNQMLSKESIGVDYYRGSHLFSLVERQHYVRKGGDNKKRGNTFKRIHTLYLLCYFPIKYLR